MKQLSTIIAMIKMAEMNRRYGFLWQAASQNNDKYFFFYASHRIQIK